MAPTTTLKLRSILLPTDFSDAAEKALIYAVALAQHFGAKITVLHVLEVLTAYSEVGYMPVDDTPMVEAANDKLREFGRSKIPAEVLAEALVERGTPFDVITSFADTRRIDLIVISTHGYTGLKHVLMGSTAERVVRHARSPVLVVREREHDFI